MSNEAERRIAVVHTEHSGRIVVLRPAEPYVAGVTLFTDRDRPDTFDADLDVLAQITGYPVEHEEL